MFHAHMKHVGGRAALDPQKRSLGRAGEAAHGGVPAAKLGEGATKDAQGWGLVPRAEESRDRKPDLRPAKPGPREVGTAD